MFDENRVVYFAETDHRKKVKFGIKGKDRSRHMYIIGKTGMGKSTLLENMAVQDIQNGEGLAFIDPHGGTAEKLLSYIPPERIKDVLYFAPFDLENPVSFNVMEDVGKDKRHLVVSGLMASFEKIWPDVWSARMEYILSNILLALLEYPGSTLLGVNRMLSDKAYRNKVVAVCTDPTVKSFWVDEFAKYSDKFMTEAGAAIQNKIGQFTSNPLIRNIVGQSRSSFDVRDIMDKKKILIANLSKGRMGETNSNLLGGMMITKIYLAAMSRAEKNEQEMRHLPPFNLYVDEFQSFANKSFADILSEARKYKLSLVMAHQYITQMPEEVRDAVFGNVGTFITFRVGAFDAEVLEKEFAPLFVIEDIVNLGFAQIYLRLMVDGVGSHPFSARTLGPIAFPEINSKDSVLESSRTTFGAPREQVEAEIVRWYGDSTGGTGKEGSAPKKVEPRAEVVVPPREIKEEPKNIKPYTEQRKKSPERNDSPKKEMKPVSLSLLKDKHAPKDNDMSDLRTVLAQALKEGVTSVQNTREIKPNPPQEKIEKKEEKNKVQFEGISEEELRSLLRVDDA